ASEDVRRQLIDIAASLLEAAPGDLRLQSGVVHVAGVPERKMSIQQITTRMGDFALMGYGFRGPNADGVTVRTWGAQFAEVDVDIETGEITVNKIVACH